MGLKLVRRVSLSLVLRAGWGRRVIRPTGVSRVVLSRGDLGRVPRPHKTNGFLGTLALWGGGWLPPPLGVGAENLLLRGQAYTHWTRAGVTEPNQRR